jgi:hypothetical protein
MIERIFSPDLPPPTTRTRRREAGAVNIRIYRYLQARVRIAAGMRNARTPRRGKEFGGEVKYKSR